MSGKLSENEPKNRTKRASQDLAGESALSESVTAPSSEDDGRKPTPEVPKCREGARELLERATRPSRMDLLDPNSQINKSEFRGLYNLAHMLSGLYLIANPLYNKFEKGYFIEPTTLETAFAPFFKLMGAWAGCFTWAFSSYFLFVAYRRHWVSKKGVTIAKHLVQAILVLGMSGVIRSHEWAIFPSTFAHSITMIHYMKMHSFLSTAVDFLEDPMMLQLGFPCQTTLWNFAMFLIAPVLVYDCDFPKSTVRFRPRYFALKLVHLVGTLCMIYLVASTLMIPVFAESYRYSFLHTWARMIVPLLLMDFLFFYMMFECICNCLAELSDYGDRRFYDDWWNCTTWEELARKWNRPVHEWLLCHFYLPYYRSRKSKFYASLLTFSFSAILHELFLSVALGVFRPIMFVVMMCQLPLIALSRFHKATTFGNYYFWFGLCLGEAGLCVVYGRKWATKFYGPDGGIASLN